MKQLKLAVIALFTLVTISNVNAQDANNPWSIGFGVNNVDFRLLKGLDDIFKDYLGTSDINLSEFISRLSVGKYLDKGFSLEAVISLNRIKHIYYPGDDVDALYYAFDLNVKYDLNELFGQTGWFDPYILSGGGYVHLDEQHDQGEDQGEGIFSIGWGANFWFNDNVGINLQSVAKKEFADKVQDHFQHSLGIVFKFGGKDSDGDGVYDKDDDCPETAGLKEFNGCPDTDADGIKDSDDACPNTAGLATLNGCPDADEDGIADKDDNCPNDKGTKANNGCPDSDGDGVVDKNDKCPTTAGPTANGGCPWPDTDGDGVLDKDDNCKNEAGPASNNGCPKQEVIISEMAEKKIGEFAKSIYFNTNSAVFRPKTKHKLNGITSIMNEFSKATFDIEGYTDNTGSNDYNQKLSKKRAKAVLNYFVEKGIDGSRLTAKGFGENNPVDTNKTRKGRKNNRRVEIKVTNKN